MVFTFSPFVHLENWLLSAVEKSLSRSQGFNSMSLFCFVAVVGQQNHTAKEFKSCKCFCDERAPVVAFFACKVWSGLCVLWLFSKGADGHTARTEKNWVESLKLKLAASLPEFTHFDVYSSQTLQSEHRCMKSQDANVCFQFVPHVFFLSLAKESRNLLFGVNCLLMSSLVLPLFIASPALEFQFGL